MVQIINDEYGGNPFGRLGKGIGKGLSEQIPKEIERNRLSSGLKALEQEKNLDPFQFFTRAATLPGITPQMVESLGRLSERRMKAQGLERFGKGNGNTEGISPFSKGLPPEKPMQNKGEVPSITTSQGVEATRRPFIPRSTPEKFQAAKAKYEANPALYGHNADEALALENQIDEDEAARSEALQKQRVGETKVQDTIKNALTSQHILLKSNVPSPVYSNLEDEAIKSVLPVSEGGRGFTEHQAAKEYGNKLDEISKDYSAVSKLGSFQMRTKGEKEVKRVLAGLQKKFASRGEQEHFAKFLQANNGLSPQISYKIAYPISDNPRVISELEKLPDLKARGPIPFTKKYTTSYQELIPKLAEAMGKSGGPLSVADAIQDRGYNADDFLDYLRKNKDRLLTPDQALQLDEARNFIPSLNDLYLFPNM